MTIWGWDATTALNNDDVDALINWQEGQLPSTVNNSARAMMQRVAQALNDVSGKLKSAGSGNAYTLTSKSGTTTLAEPLMVAFEADKTNTGASTLALDGLTAKPITHADGTAVIAGDIVDGGIYLCAYNAALDSFVGVNIPNIKYYSTSGTAAAVASLTIDFTAMIAAGYRRFTIRVGNLKPAVDQDSLGFALSTNSGSTFIGSGVRQITSSIFNLGDIDASDETASSTSSAYLGSNHSNSSGKEASMTIDMWMNTTYCNWSATGYINSFSTSAFLTNSGRVASAINAIRFGFVGGNIATMDYGIEAFR